MEVGTGYMACEWKTYQRTTFKICLGVNTLIGTEALVVGTGSPTGRESNITSRPLLPRTGCTPLLRGRARAAHSVGADTVTDLFRGLASAVDPRRGETIRASETAWIVGETLRLRIVRIRALLSNVELSWAVNQGIQAARYRKSLTTSAVTAFIAAA